MSRSKFELLSKVKVDDMMAAYAIVDEPTKAAFNTVLSFVEKVHASKLQEKPEEGSKKKRGFLEMKQTDVNGAIEVAITKFCDEAGSGNSLFFAEFGFFFPAFSFFSSKLFFC